MLSNTALRKVARSLLQRGALCQRTFGSTADLLAPKMVYTDTDEAPYLATYSLLPVIKRFAEPAGVNVVKADISVAARILSQFPERLTAEQRVNDELTQLGVSSAV